ncbi:MAG: XRE family transcriptional regulator, partial [Oscillospiraceae bacterium]|nr:XRE family transcriptional regulator [Oscillospiraceae bacterium]
SMEEANRFLRINEKRAPRTALGVSLCILSPIALIILAGLSDYRPDFFGSFTISENVAGGIGVAVLLAIIAFAVVIFIMSGRELRDFEYLENEFIDTNYGVSGMAKERRETYSARHTKSLILGTVICILSVIPLFLAAITDDDLTAIMGFVMLLAICSAGAYILVKTSIINDGYNMLLEEDGYSRERKSDKKKRRDIMVIYWLIVTAVYIGYIFYARAHFFDKSGWSEFGANGLVIWAVAGLICPVVSRIVKMIRK